MNRLRQILLMCLVVLVTREAAAQMRHPDCAGCFEETVVAPRAIAPWMSEKEWTEREAKTFGGRSMSAEEQCGPGGPSSWSKFCYDSINSTVGSAVFGKGGVHIEVSPVKLERAGEAALAHAVPWKKDHDILAQANAVLFLEVRDHSKNASLEVTGIRIAGRGVHGFSVVRYRHPVPCRSSGGLICAPPPLLTRHGIATKTDHPPSTTYYALVVRANPSSLSELTLQFPPLGSVQIPDLHFYRAERLYPPFVP